MATDDLFEAAQNGTVSEARAALPAGANPGARGESSETPLHWAAVKSNPSAITALIESGVDPGARDDAGNTPFDYLKENLAFEALRGTDAYRLLKEDSGG